MKSYFPLLLFAVATVSLQCSDDPDPRGAYIGSFEMEDFNVNVLQNEIDTNFVVASNPDIEFSYSDKLNSSKLQLDAEEFIDDILSKTIGKMIDPTTGLTFEIDDDQWAEIDGGRYETNEIDFILTLSDEGVTQDFDSEFSGNGVLNGNSITIDFNIAIYFGPNSFYLSGSAKGSRQ